MECDPLCSLDASATAGSLPSQMPVALGKMFIPINHFVLRAAFVILAGGGREVSANFERLILGCIDADICE